MIFTISVPYSVEETIQNMEQIYVQNETEQEVQIADVDVSLNWINGLFHELIPSRQALDLITRL